METGRNEARQAIPKECKRLAEFDFLIEPPWESRRRRAVLEHFGYEVVDRFP